MNRMTDAALTGMTRYIDDQISDIRYLYDTLFPDDHCQIDLWWGQAPDPTPSVRPTDHGDISRPETPGFIDRIHIGDRNAPVRYHVTLALPDPDAPTTQAEPLPRWYARYKLARAAFRLSPRAFEAIKFWRERSAERRRADRHEFDTAHRADVATPDDSTTHAKPPAALIGFHWLEVGGAENLAFDSVEWALEAGLRVFVVAQHDAPHRAANKLPDDPRVRFLRSDRYIPWNLLPDFFCNLAQRENITLTHNHHCASLYDSLPALTARCPQIKHLDSTHVVEFADGGFPRLSGVWSRHLDLHHVISRDLETFLRSHFDTPSKIALGRLLSDTSRSAEIPDPNLSAGQKTCRVAFVGRMVHQKRPVLVVDIMRALVRWGDRAGVAFEFDMVGEGPYRELCARMIRAYGLQGRVRLHQARVDVPVLLSKCDILLLPSSNEGLALVCYEAIEAGCLPITTDVGAQSELLPPELLVSRAPARTIRETVRAITRLLRDQALVDQVGAELHRKFDAVRNDPSARDVLMPIYRAACSDQSVGR